jgi:DNA-binding response OmpR family regulator
MLGPPFPTIWSENVARVLCTGVDPNLLKTRKLILEDAGHKVTTAQGRSAAEKACKQHKFHVIVIGQALDGEEKRGLAAIARRHCAGAKLLELYDEHSDRSVDDADDWLAVPSDVPQELAERVTALAKKPPA